MKRIHLLMFKSILSALVLIALTACSTMSNIKETLMPVAEASQADINAHKLAIEGWQQRRVERLKQPYGWLSLVGLFWLEPGENTVGSGIGNDIVLNAGPEHWGTVIVNDDEVRFLTANDLVTIEGQHQDEVKLIADVDGDSNVVEAGTTQFYLIKRGSYALRVKDSAAPGRTKFVGLDHYPIDVDWKVEGKFIPAEKGDTIPISNVLGQLDDSTRAGTFEFNRDGKTYRLDALDAGDQYFFLFADKTNGHGSYGAGRFIYTDLAEDGHLSVDFNKAYNPPCAFNEYSTCPLPPPQNRLPLAINAGEKDFHN